MRADNGGQPSVWGARSFLSETCDLTARCDSPAVTERYERGRWVPVCVRHAGWVKSPPVRLIHRLNPWHLHKCVCGAGHHDMSTCGPCRCGAARGTYLCQ